jgi:RNA polymerase sigma-70 factor (ECF subfamily)
MQNKLNVLDRLAIRSVGKDQRTLILKHASDQDLIKAIAAGCQASMRCLFVRHKERVYKFILRSVGDATVAMDLTSDVFVAVWTQAGTFRGQSSVSTWLLSIARYKAVSALRRRAHETVDIDQLTIVDSADDPETAIEKRDRSRLVRECVLQLSLEHREIVGLLYYDDRSMEEVSKIARIPLGTAKSRASYARRRLSDLLVAAGVAT